MPDREPQSKATGKTPETRTGALLSFILRFERFGGDLAGMFLLTLALLTTLGLAGISQGALLGLWAKFLRIWLGYGSWLIVILIVWGGWRMLSRRSRDDQPLNWGRVFALEGAAICGLALLALLGGVSLVRAESGLDGGQIGWGLAELASLIMPQFLATVLLGLLFIILLSAGVGSWHYVVEQARKRVASRQDETIAGTSVLAGEPGISISPTKEPVSSLRASGKERKKLLDRIPNEFRKNFQLPEKEEKATSPMPRDEHLPPLTLLSDERATRPDERHINLTAGLIEQTLAEFGIPARVIGFQVGPTVTQFAVEPGFVAKTGNGEDDAVRHKVRVAQISGLSRDLALALSAQRLRIEAPVPGRPYIGIEVPNSRSSVVRLRPLLETEAFHKLDSPLAIALGRDVSGKALVADLGKMPHLLIAGTTGSGKSVCIAAITTCLVMNNTPEDLRLVMVDPKMVELVRFNGLPHLLGKVETDLERILGVLRWTVAEMDRRYKMLEESRSRHIDTYNRKMRQRKGGEVLPRIVVLIDELADLMMSAPEQTEPSLVRLAQLARATGIHLVIATQRPSTDVVTGLIKANFPARLSFSVASSVDSRVILDTTGAEALLGRGDMLFLPPDAPSPMRAQGAIVTDQEIEKLINFWQKEHIIEEPETPPWEEIVREQEMLADRDDLVNQAIKVVQGSQRASTSLLQRRLKIGYPRAARLMDELEELGVVGPNQGGGREREVLIGPENDQLEHEDL
jgi:DNA segregation ATPase FtsK/SpoIIIE, S-DNA-T family